MDSGGGSFRTGFDSPASTNFRSKGFGEAAKAANNQRGVGGREASL